MDSLKLFFLFFCFLLLQFSFAQEPNQKVILQINEQDIKVEEFIDVYYKGQGIALDKATIQKDFKFFVSFKLKLAEAKRLRLDTLQHLINELDGYRFQLARSMFPNSEVNFESVAELEKTNDPFRKICDDFRNGVYLFELMNKEVWLPAQDSLKLDFFFNQNRAKYRWPERISASIITVLDHRIIDEVKSFAAQNDINGALSKFNSEEEQLIIVKTGLFEEGENEFLKSVKKIEGISEVLKVNGKLKFAVIHFIFEPEFKQLNEMRATVIDDFQQHLEEKWIADLKLKHKIKIYKRVLNKLAK